MRTTIFNIDHMRNVLDYIRDNDQCWETQADGQRCFSSHTIIRVYCGMYEHEYVAWISTYSSHDHVFEDLHKKIGQDLSYCSEQRTLPILKVNNYPSGTIHGTIDKPMWWRFV